MALPSSTSPPVMAIVDMIGGGGRLPSITAFMNSRPDMPAAAGSTASGSSQVTVRVRAFEPVKSSPKTTLRAGGFQSRQDRQKSERNDGHTAERADGSYDRRRNPRSKARNQSREAAPPRGGPYD